MYDEDTVAEPERGAGAFDRGKEKTEVQQRAPRLPLQLLRRLSHRTEGQALAQMEEPKHQILKCDHRNLSCCPDGTVWYCVGCETAGVITQGSRVGTHAYYVSLLSGSGLCGFVLVR